ncbi:hypothetical protein BDK51DRAFT_39243 [Blyttiomyces helicus]|uniref:Uncharacterized protein n=1 Tax=Blyttiomyces helicus TaxID=388810 RepID=A0A4P9WIL7_9FUNG|nr:hypothetical protein BDK51DRAFT_39243 [Blyttiomyces helicus]|eukprot:RKO92634.1 hypothetical protein BDK51DRAFT_39243 [Blyttiomyces helicus]
MSPPYRRIWCIVLLPRSRPAAGSPFYPVSIVLALPLQSRRYFAPLIANVDGREGGGRGVSGDRAGDEGGGGVGVVGGDQRGSSKGAFDWFLETGAYLAVLILSRSGDHPNPSSSRSQSHFRGPHPLLGLRGIVESPEKSGAYPAEDGHR